MSDLRVLDLYSGIGGLSLGTALALRPKQILGLDINKNAVLTYNLNLERYNAHSIQADVLDWTPEKGYFDLVVGGSPCEPFSIANARRRGEKHPLFPTLRRFFDLVLELRPTAFIHENVKGLLSTQFRHIYEEQLNRIKDHYYVSARTLNSADYGVPQKRERLITIGIHRSLGKKPSLPIQTHAERPITTIYGTIPRWLTLRDAIQDIVANPPTDTVIFRQEQVERIRRERENTRGIHWGCMEFPDSLDKPARTISSHTIEGTKRETIVIQMRDGLYRRLTVREALRVQSFPDWWNFPDGITITTKFKLIGEAVPPILAYKIARSLAIDLGWEWHPPTPEDFELPYFERAFPELVATIKR